MPRFCIGRSYLFARPAGYPVPCRLRPVKLHAIDQSHSEERPVSTKASALPSPLSQLLEDLLRSLLPRALFRQPLRLAHPFLAALTRCALSLDSRPSG